MANVDNALAIHIIDGSWVGKSTSEISQLLGKSLASVSNYFKEIELVLPQVIGSQGRKRFIAEVEDMSAAKLLETFEPYLSSPVATSGFLKFKDGKEGFLPKGCFYAGVTALSMLTMLADDHWTTYATDEYNRDFLDEYTGRMDVVGKDDAPDILLEIWNYDIDANALIRTIFTIHQRVCPIFTRANCRRTEEYFNLLLGMNSRHHALWVY